jgi:hypothetical protein
MPSLSEPQRSVNCQSVDGGHELPGENSREFTRCNSMRRVGAMNKCCGVHNSTNICRASHPDCTFFSNKRMPLRGKNDRQAEWNAVLSPEPEQKESLKASAAK